MLFDLQEMRVRKPNEDFRPAVTNAQLKNMGVMDLPIINAHIATFFDAHVRDQNQRVCVPLNCQDPWPPALVPVWLACGRDEEAAAMLLGNLYCRYAIRRPEWWWCASLSFTKRLKGEPARIIGPARNYHIGADPVALGLTRADRRLKARR
jgi:hypothetical protein